MKVNQNKSLQIDKIKSHKMNFNQNTMAFKIGIKKKRELIS